MVKVIELVLPLSLVDPKDAIIPSPNTDPNGPTELVIIPIETVTDARRELVFRVAFEPDNHERRVQPYRNTMEPKFPNNWKYGDTFEKPSIDPYSLKPEATDGNE